MGRPLAAAAAPAAPGIPAAAAAAAFLLLALAALLAASEQPPRPANATDIHGSLWKGSRPPAPAPAHGAPPGNDGPAPPTRANASAAAGAEGARRQAPALLPGPAGAGQAAAAAAATDAPPAASSARGPGVAVRGASGALDGERDQPGPCPGCPAGTEAEAPREARSAAPGWAQPAPGRGGPWTLPGAEGAAARSPPPGAPDSPEEAGSGDQPAQPSPGPAASAAPTTGPPPALARAGAASSRAPGPALGPASAEEAALLRELLRGAAAAAGLATPTPSGPVHRAVEAGRPRDPHSAQKQEPLELWADASRSSPAAAAAAAPEGAAGRTDPAWPTPLLAAGTPPGPAAPGPKPSPDPLASEIIDIDYYDLFDGEGLGAPGPDATKTRPPDGKGAPWSLRDLYDDFTPFDESDFYPTTSFYADGDEEDLEEPEEEEDEEDEEEEEEGGAGGLARDLADENGYRIPTLATPKIQTVLQEAESTSRRYLLPPPLVSGGSGVATPRPRPAEAGRDLSLSRGGGGGENGTECRGGYVRHNATCKSVCDTFPSYCHNGGQCYLVESLGAFCRCNTQDYIWHKGVRCESIITDFQVMCVAVGSAALVVLLLFMMTVFFAKKLYLLKTENSKLRKTKYRTPSELHNDNFSLSTIAEGSHPNVRKFCDTPCNLSPHARALAYYDNIICQDDPNALHKLQDPLKSCLKEEESFNIQNSMSPKIDNGKADPDDSEVNCLQNNLT